MTHCLSFFLWLCFLNIDIKRRWAPSYNCESLAPDLKDPYALCAVYLQACTELSPDSPRVPQWQNPMTNVAMCRRDSRIIFESQSISFNVSSFDLSKNLLIQVLIRTKHIPSHKTTPQHAQWLFGLSLAIAQRLLGKIVLFLCTEAELCL